MFTTLNQQWDLDAFFPGGSVSPAFEAFLDQLDADLNDVRAELGAMQAPQALADCAARAGQSPRHRPARSRSLFLYDVPDLFRFEG